MNSTFILSVYRPTLTNIHPTSDNLREQIVQQADLCVMCGMCSAQCPTYQLSHDENDSPRGRIALLRGLATEQLDLAEKTQKHLDTCLLCRSCEKKCPSGVLYGQLMDNGREMIRDRKSHSSKYQKAIKLGLYLTSHKSKLLGVRRLLRFLQLLRLDVLAENLGITHALGLQRASALLPRLSPLKSLPAKTSKQEYVELFTGCISDAVDRDAVLACIRILEACDIGARAPKQQTCCGALARHHGEAEQANALAEQNRTAFSGANPILFFATGCGASLLDDPSLMPHIKEACAYLDALPQLEKLTLKPLKQKIAIHQPCSHRNVTGDSDSIGRLLRRIPDITLVDTHPGAPNCCGAGGSTMLEHPSISDPLREQTLDALMAAQPSILVSTNIGCALHLTAGLRMRGLDIEVLHPVVLFARQLENTQQ